MESIRIWPRRKAEKLSLETDWMQQGMLRKEAKLRRGPDQP